MPLMAPLHDVICSLLEKPFLYWKQRDQIDVINTGRPKASICKIRNSSADPILNSRFQHFKRVYYYRFEWLCGSTYLQNLHCWPCLLFADDSKKWFCDQYSECNELSIFENHAKEESHRICCKKLHNFDKRKHLIEENIAKRTALRKLTSQDSMRKEDIRLNRRCAQFAIDAVLYMIKNEMPLRDKGVPLRGNHAELVILLMSKNSDEDLKEHFLKMKSIPNPILASQIQTAIIESLSNCIEDYIKDAINDVPFFSLRIDDGLYESTDCSIFLRCIKSGELKEYFLGSYSLGTDKTSLSLFRIVDSLLENYQYKSKLVGISYDITSVKFNYLKDLRVGLKFMAQQTIHVNLLSHNLDYLLERCLYSLPTCRSFFSTISTLLSIVQKLVKKSHFTCSSTWRDVTNLQSPCCSKLKFLSAVVDDFLVLKTTLQDVAQDLTLSEEQICLVSNVLVKLNDFEFIFLIVLFNHIFQLTDGVYQILRANPLDPKLCHGKVKDVCVIFYRERNNYHYSQIRDLTTRIMTQQSPSETSSVPIPENSPNDDQLFLNSARKDYKNLYYDILDNVIMELHTRYENVDKYTFFDLADSYLFETHVSLKHYTEERFHNLFQFYPELFKKKILLFNELLKVTKNRRYWKLPILRILQLIIETREVFVDEAYKLFCLIALLTPTNKEFPCLHKYSNYLKNANANHTPYLAKILMNQDVLNVLNNRFAFKDELLNKLALNCDELRLSRVEKVAVKEVTPENLSESSTFELYKPEDQTDEPTILKMVPNLMGVQDSDMVVELDPTQFVSQDMYPSYISEPGPSSRMEPDSSVMEDDVHLAMTCEVFPVTTEPDSQYMNIKTKGEPPDIFRQDILSATVERELSHFSKDTQGEHSLFEAPILIKEEIVSSEEDS